MTGVSQPSPLAVAQRNAQALRDAGDVASACRLLARTLESARPAYGEDHPEVLASAHLLARLHQEADDPAAARRVLEEAIAAGQRRLGDADALMLAMSFDLGSVAEELGNRHEARRNFGRVATLGPAVLGDDHWTVRAARDYLGDSFAAGGQPVADPPPVAPPQSNPPLFPRVTSPDPLAPAPPVAPAFLLSEPRQVQPQPTEAPPAHAQPALPRPVYEAPAYPIEVAVGGPSPYPTFQRQPATAAPPAAPAVRGRGVTIAAAVAATAAAVAATVVTLVTLTDRSAPTPGAADVSTGPTLAGDPPTDLRLREEGSSIAISWTDPTAGTVPFIVAGGRAGKTLAAMATISPGETSYKVNGLNPRADYCFTVVAVYSTDRYATSGQVCTARATPASR